MLILRFLNVEISLHFNFRFFRIFSVFWYLPCLWWRNWIFRP